MVFGLLFQLITFVTQQSVRGFLWLKGWRWEEEIRLGFKNQLHLYKVLGRVFSSLAAGFFPPGNVTEMN